jgi:nucleotide-binding universal stress UspA family protein
MTLDKDYLGDKLRLLGRAREDAHFRQLDQERIDKMRQQAAAQEKEAGQAGSRPEPVLSTILAPVDFSSYSLRALETSADMAKRFDAKIIALHVIDSEVGAQALASRLGVAFVATAGDESAAIADISDDDIQTILDQQREQAYRALEAFLPPVLATCSLELRVLFGRPFERIIETAVKEEAGLIVMGTHGRTGLAHLTLGSIAERVVRLAPCAVLTVKDPTPETESWLQDFYATFLGIGPSETQRRFTPSS